MKTCNHPKPPGPPPFEPGDFIVSHGRLWLLDRPLEWRYPDPLRGELGWHYGCANVKGWKKATVEEAVRVLGACKFDLECTHRRLTERLDALMLFLKSIDLGDDER